MEPQKSSNSQIKSLGMGIAGSKSSDWKWCHRGSDEASWWFPGMGQTLGSVPVQNMIQTYHKVKGLKIVSINIKTDM